jgi:hypothetical protein
MPELTTQDYRDAWRLVCEMTEAARDAVSFGQQGAEQLPRLVASEITTLSVCDLRRNTRSVYCVTTRIYLDRSKDSDEACWRWLVR